MANIKSIGGNPIVLDASGIAAGAVTPDKLADMGGITAGAALGITGNGPTDSAAWLQRVSTSDGPTTIRSIHGNTVVQDGALLPVNMGGIETEDANGDPLQTRTIPAGILRGAGSVYDEQTATERITRVGVVAMNAVTWMANTAGVFFIDETKLPMLRGGNTGIVLSCSAYTPISSVSGAGSMASAADMTIAAGSIASPRIYVKDTRYATADEFNAATTDALIFYPLVTPTVTPIDPPLNMTYRTEQGGTERIIVPTGENSAPPTIVAAQGYTAESLRDAALSAIAPVENGLASTNYGVGSYLVHGGQLCKVNTAIATGEAITIGTNVTATTVMAEVIALTQ